METRANYVIIGLFTLAVMSACSDSSTGFSNIGGTAERAEV